MSIILGLGIRELLVGGRAAAVERPRGALVLLPFLAGVLVLIATVQFWWYLFIVANRGAWAGNFFLFAATLLRPALLFLASASVFPPPGSGEPLDRHYFRNRGFIFVPMAIFEAQNMFESAANLGTLLHPAHIFHLIFIVMTVVLAISRSAWLHKMLLSSALLLASVFIATFSLSLN